MTGRSLKVSSEKLKLVRQALAEIGLKHEVLRIRAECSRSTVSKFFNGKPVDTKIFCGICKILRLNAQDVAYQDNEVEVTDIDSLVQEVRQKIKPLIQERCGTMRVLDMTQPIGLNDIYTNVNILEKITANRRKEVAELLQEGNFENFDRCGLGRISEKGVPGLEAVEKYPKLMVWGKPGAGKTTFLKYLAIQSIDGNFKSELVPIFITLKDFAEANDKPNLLEYISQQLSTCQVTDNQVVEIIQHDKGLMLLDGLDEVREEDNQRVLKEIRDFSDHFRDNHFVMTCRIAAKEYTFEKFSDVEVADFYEPQIATFANNWFKDKPIKPDDFMKRLEENHRIYDLATNPLLLTLLCLVFEESGDFPANRSELYEEGLDALLKKWDAKRGISRDQVYKKLSVQRKEDLLSKIALNTFKNSDYFFKHRVAEQHIIEYIRNLPDASADPERLQLDSERVLKSIEAQHGLLVERAKGIYSFSHLTFHEYFTAREFITVQQSSEAALKNLLEHMMEKRWREVLFLALGMSPSADRLLLLMKEKVDEIATADENLQQFLRWVNQKSISLYSPYKPVNIRNFYFDKELVKVHALFGGAYRRLDCNLDHDIYLLLEFDNFNFLLNSHPNFEILVPHSADIELFIKLDPNIVFCSDLDHDHRQRYRILDGDLYRVLNPEFQLALRELKEQLPKKGNQEEKAKWWESNSNTWIEQLRTLMIKYHDPDLEHDWQFNEQQNQLLKQYHDANILLVDCLNSDCYVSREVRQYIEETLLLPISEIEKYPKPNL